MFSVGIVVPGWHYWANPARIQPMYELYFATLLESCFSPKDVRVDIIDLRGIRQDQQVFHVAERNLYVYWITKTGDYSRIQKLVGRLRAAYPQTKHVAGGTHIDIFAGESGKDFDAIVVGPGEESLVSLINNCLTGQLGKTYRGDYKDAHYADYPFMRRHFLPETAIVNPLLFEKYGENIRSTCVLFSRGCVFKCKFCVYNVPSVIQMRSLKSIEEEIKYLQDEYRVQAINLKDEICIPLKRETAVPYLDALKRSKIIWRGQTTIFGTDEDVLKMASESGCVELAIGVESVSQQVLDIVGKKINPDQVKSFIKTCRKYGIKVKMCLIFGLPGEPRDIVALTRSFIEEARPDYVSLSGFDPVPGSEIFQNAGYYGIKDIDTDWEKHAHLLYRFSEKEEVGLPFHYEKRNRWGATFSREEIIQNIIALQTYCRQQGLTY